MKFNLASMVITSWCMICSISDNSARRWVISRSIMSMAEFTALNFGEPAELAYIQNNYVHLDHDQTYTASAGASYQVLPKTALDLDAIYGSGLREGFANTGHLPWYTQFNAGVTEDLDLFPKEKTQLRFSVINLFDTAYEL